MKNHLAGLAVGLITFSLGWSIATIPFQRKCTTGVLTVRVARATLPPWAVLLSYRDRDLTKIESAEPQLRTAIDALRGRIENERLNARLFSRISTTEGKSRYVLIEESPLETIPGDSRLRISLFDLDGRLIDSSQFGAGWRISLSEIRFMKVKDVEGEVLEVRSYRHINGADVAKQYYALLGDTMTLIRLEDSSGALFQNTYRAPNHTIGHTQTGRPAADWERALVSNDTAEVLATLIWLGGHHLDPSEGDGSYVYEDLSEARLAKEVRQRSAVKAAVNALRNSDNPWVREAASAAAEMMRPQDR